MTQTVLLGDIANLKYGKMPKKDRVSNRGRYPIFTGYRIAGYYDEYNCDEKLIVVARGVGGTGDVKISPKKSDLTNISIMIDLDEEVASKEYLYYQLTAGLKHLDTGSAQSQITTSDLRRLKVSLPAIEEQKKIANILGTIDEKIELNRQMNDTLEQMGQALFRHYFIDNPEAERWEDGVVSDLITIYSGYAFKRTDFDPDGDYGLVTIKNVQDGNFVPECSDHLSSIPVKTPDYAFLNTGDILLSLTGNVGRVCIVHGENLLLNQRVAKLVGADDKQSFAYFMFRQEEFKNRLISMSRGTAQLNLSPIETKKIKLKLPPKELLAQYHEQAEPLFEAITANYTEIQTLTTLRDTLLPRLISGKVKV